MENKRIYKIGYASKKLNISKESLYRWIKLEKSIEDCYELFPVPSKKRLHGREYRFSMEDIKKIAELKGCSMQSGQQESSEDLQKIDSRLKQLEQDNQKIFSILSDIGKKLDSIEKRGDLIFWEEREITKEIAEHEKTETPSSSDVSCDSAGVQFARRIRKIREMLEIGQKEFAEILGMSQAQICKIEKYGTKEYGICPNFSDLKRIEKNIGITFDAFTLPEDKFEEIVQEKVEIYSLGNNLVGKMREDRKPKVDTVQQDPDAYSTENTL